MKIDIIMENRPGRYHRHYSHYAYQFDNTRSMLHYVAKDAGVDEKGEQKNMINFSGIFFKTLPRRPVSVRVQRVVGCVNRQFMHCRKKNHRRNRKRFVT